MPPFGIIQNANKRYRPDYMQFSSPTAGPNYGGGGYDSPAPVYRQPRRDDIDDATLLGPSIAPRRTTAPGMAGPFQSAPSLPMSPRISSTLANNAGNRAAGDQFIQSQRAYGIGPGMAPSVTPTGTSQTVMPTAPYMPAPQFHQGNDIPLSMIGPETGRPGPMFQPRSEGGWQSAPNMSVPGPTISAPGYVTGGAPNVSAPGTQSLTAPNMAPRVLPQYAEAPGLIAARQDALMARHAAEAPYLAAPYDQSEMRQNQAVASGADESGSRADYNRALGQNLPAQTEAQSAAGDYKRLSQEHALLQRQFQAAQTQLGEYQRQEKGINNRVDRQGAPASPGLELNRELGGVYTDPESGEMHFKNYPKVPMGDAVDKAREVIKSRTGGKPGAQAGKPGPVNQPAAEDAIEIQSQEEYDALPSGTSFNWKGKTATKR